ncbi:MAG: type II toxin-antitoxin system HipA family toxin [Thiolinea sp.]
MVINDAPEKKLLVLMNGLLVGCLRKSSDGGLSFRYDDSWLERPGKRPISLSLPTEPSFHAGEKVYSFFDNLLPDNPAILQHIQQRFSVRSNHPFDLLEAIGRDCIGAIQLHSDDQIYDLRTIIGKPLSDKELEERFISSRTAPLGMSDTHEEFRISLAGAQDKTGLLWHDEKWQSPEGTTPTTHIIKLPIGKIDYNNIDLSDSVDNEWLCLKILELYGLEITQAERLTVGDTTVLSVKRFDRQLHSSQSWVMRLPQEDMCQALGFSSGQKYEAHKGPGIPEIMKLLERSRQKDKDQADFMRVNFLFWLMAAPDGHAKNFSIFLKPDGEFQLTPFYDVLSVYPFMNSGALQKQKLKMAMSLRGSKRYYNWHKIQLRHFFSTAEQSGFSRENMRQIVEETLAGTKNVLEQAQAILPADFPVSVSDPIFVGIEQTANKLSQQL